MLAKLESFFAKIIEPAATPTDTSHDLDNHLMNVTVSKSASMHLVRFSTKEKVLFAKRLAFLSKAGVSILDSVIIIRNQTRSKRKRHIFDTVIDDVAAGRTLSKSLERYKQLFGEFTVNIISVGENAGVLPENLMYLAEELAKKRALQSKVQSALIYPIFITIATLGVTGMLVVFIFPKIMPIFVSLNVTLPWTTRSLLWLSEFLSHHGLLTILGFIFVIVAFGVSRRLFQPIRFATDWLLLKLPIAGGITKSYNCANFCRTLGLNVNSGITLTDSLLISASVTENTLYQEAYLDFASHVMKGEKISTAMAKYPQIFPDMLPQMILIGETTGSLTSTLGYLSDLYEAEVEESTRNLSNSIEPILLMMMGILVGIIAVSVIAPIYEVTKSIGNVR